MLRKPDIGLPGPCSPSRPMPCPCGHALLRGSTYLEQTLQLSFYKLCLKVRHHSSRRTPGPGPSRSGSGFGSTKVTYPQQLEATTQPTEPQPLPFTTLLCEMPNACNQTTYLCFLLGQLSLRWWQCRERGVEDEWWWTLQTSRKDLLQGPILYLSLFATTWIPRHLRIKCTL